MAYIDIFNGDADGICALIQLRLAEPRESRLLTGVKRDIGLVGKAALGDGDVATILDISLDKNREALELALQKGARCLYVDHHFPGAIPRHEQLHTLIDTAADMCTSLLVNQHLQGAFVEWALVGAFGDNLHGSALSLAEPLGLSEQQLSALSRLGLYVNYNGYGASVADLHFAPDELFRLLSRHRSPFDFIAGDAPGFNRLEQGYKRDMAHVRDLTPELADAQTAVYVLPGEPWARRVSGVFSNDLANASPHRAHAVLTDKGDGTYLVSVRAPLEARSGADEICRQFPGGGGRKAAAGINELPATDLRRFIAVFREYYNKS